MKSSLFDELNSYFYSYYNKYITLVSLFFSCRPYNSKNMRNWPNLSFSLNVILKRIKLHSVHSALDVERFRDHGFVFQNSNEPVPKCTCSLNACLHLESTINL